MLGCSSKDRSVVTRCIPEPVHLHRNLQEIYITQTFFQIRQKGTNNTEVKHDVYEKRQTAKMKLLPSVFSSLYSRLKILISAVNSTIQYNTIQYNNLLNSPRRGFSELKYLPKNYLYNYNTIQNVEYNLQ